MKKNLVEVKTKKVLRGWYTVIINGKEICSINNYQGFWSIDKTSTLKFIPCCERTKKAAVETITEYYIRNLASEEEVSWEEYMAYTDQGN